MFQLLFKKYHFAQIFILIVLLFLALLPITKIALSTNLQDLAVYTAAAQDLSQERNPYANPVNNYVYPPSSFFFLWPLTISFPSSAVFWWTFTSVAALGVAITLFWLGMKKSTFKNEYQSIWLFLVLALLAFPVKFSLGMGQINCLVLALVAAAFYFDQKRHSKLSGFFLGLAAGIKLFPFFLLLLMVKDKKWSSIVSCVGTFLVLTFLSIKWVGWNGIQFFYQQRLWSLGGWQNYHYFNQGMSGFLARLNINSITISGMVLITGLLLLILAIRSFVPNKNGLEAARQWSLLICIWLIVQSVAWQHYFVFLLLPLLYLVQRIFFSSQTTALKPKLWLGACYLLAAFNIRGTPNLGIFSAIIYSHLFLVTGIIYVLLLAPLPEERSEAK